VHQPTAKQAAVAVVRTLREAGHEALFAGGAVRDLLLELTPSDYDVATSARPEQVVELFSHTVTVGAQFGVVVVRTQGHAVEVATFRSEEAYLDGRHPERVVYSTAEQDVRRRDFTINGLLYDPLRERVIDHVEGQADLRARRLRCIGDPQERFAEDRLRMLRAIRFAVRFALRIDPATWTALQRQAAEIVTVSAERVRDELLRMLAGPRPQQAVQLLQRAGLLAPVLPEVEALRGVEQPARYHPEGDVFTHTLLLLEHLVPPAKSPPWAREALWLAALLHDVGKPETLERDPEPRFPRHARVGAAMAEQIARRLRLSRRQVSRVRDLVAQHTRFFDVQKMRPARRLRLLRQPHIEDLLALHRADRLAGSKDLSTWRFCRQELARLPPERLRPPPLLDGHRLLALGVPRGPQVGQMVRRLEDAQLEGRVHTEAEAEAFVRAALRNGGEQGADGAEAAGAAGADGANGADGADGAEGGEDDQQP